jgi:dipeptidyl aminopeptidase/acylaminoacyl peptidase
MTDPHPITPQDVVDHVVLRDAQISPDGRYVAFTRRSASKPGTPELPGEIWLADVATGQSRRFTFGGDTDQYPRWSPDGKRLLFMSDRAHPGQRQLYVIDVDGGEARALTDLRGTIDWPAWSPGGREIAFVHVQEEPHSLIPGADARLAGHEHYRRLYAIDVETKAIRPLSPDGCQIHEFAWSPRGDWLAIIAKQGDATPSGWYTAQLYVLDADGDHTEMQRITHAGKQICAVTWSPDGTQIAYLTSIISDQPLWQGDVCLVGASGGQPRQITPSDAPMSITQLDWIARDVISYSARQLDGTSFGRLTVSAGRIEPLWSDYAMIGDWTVPRISLSADGSAFAAILERPDAPPQVYAGELDAAAQPWRQISQFAYSSLQLGKMERTAWRAADGLEIVGHIVYPVGYQPGQRYPTFVQIHGGPAWSWLPHYAVWWEWWYQYLAGQGYLVFLPNIRGSSGRGTVYTEANVPDMGGADFQDVLSGLDHLIALGLADPERLGIGGWSYGGFMTAWAVTQTTRFKAAIMGAGIASWESYYGQNSIRDWQRVYFGSTPYEDPAAHRARSPVAFIRRARTPTLILQGEEDQDVSPTQAREMYTALRAMGVEAELVTYPREHHPILERQHQLDLLARVLEWCDRYLKR